MKPHLIFDLDGTLIDSANSILKSFDLAFQHTGIPRVAPLNHAVIGPPLMQTLARLSGRNDEASLQQLAAAFKHEYDQVGYLETEVYAGVSALLHQLHLAGRHCYIATNKRLYPTQKIVAHLGWQSLFSDVFALDYFQPALNNKAAMIGDILQTKQLNPADCFYIGDRVEDGLAADAHHMDFIWVTWGYAESVAAHPPHWQVCETLLSLASTLGVTALDERQHP